MYKRHSGENSAQNLSKTSPLSLSFSLAGSMFFYYLASERSVQSRARISVFQGKLNCHGWDALKIARGRTRGKTSRTCCRENNRFDGTDATRGFRVFFFSWFLNRLREYVRTRVFLLISSLWLPFFFLFALLHLTLWCARTRRSSTLVTNPAIRLSCNFG